MPRPDNAALFDEHIMVFQGFHKRMFREELLQRKLAELQARYVQAANKGDFVTLHRLPQIVLVSEAEVDAEVKAKAERLGGLF